MNLMLLERVADELRVALSEYEPERIDGPDADRMLVGFAEIEKLAVAGKLLSARRVESSNIWRRKGHRSAAAHVADATGTGLGSAITALETARQLGALPTTDGALRSGRLSEAQVKEIAGAAILQPNAERELVEAAGNQPLNVLKLRCRRVKAAGGDQHETYEKIRKNRYFRHWSDDDGAVRLDARLTPDEGARLVAAIKDEAGRLGSQARKLGIDEPAQALAADALVQLACDPLLPAHNGGEADVGNGNDREGTSPSNQIRTAPGGPRAMVHVRVDYDSLMRGHVGQGEICEIPGIGPVPVEVARRLAADSILSVLVTNGVDVTAVSRADRTIPTALRTALIERDPTCVVPGCEIRDRLEIDHTHNFHEGGPTSLANLARLCHWHHYLKTHQRHRLERLDDQWVWTAPEMATLPPHPATRSG